jgi:hypothetical protein
MRGEGVGRIMDAALTVLRASPFPSFELIGHKLE